MILRTRTNTGEGKKNTAEMREEKVEAIQTKLFTENFIYDSMDVFSK